MTAKDVSHVSDASAPLLSGRRVFGMSEDDIIFSSPPSSFFLLPRVGRVCVLPPSTPLHSLSFATLSLQGLNLRLLLSTADQFKPVFKGSAVCLSWNLGIGSCGAAMMMMSRWTRKTLSQLSESGYTRWWLCNTCTQAHIIRQVVISGFISVQS